MVEVVVVMEEEEEEEVGDGKKVQFSRGVMSDIMLWRAEHAGFMGASRGGCPTHTNNSKKRLEWQVAVVVILSFALVLSVFFFSFYFGTREKRRCKRSRRRRKRKGEKCVCYRKEERAVKVQKIGHGEIVCLCSVGEGEEGKQDTHRNGNFFCCCC